jgi:hypothetical protein
MMEVHIDSIHGPSEAAQVRRLAYEAARRADAMGLVHTADVRALDQPAIAHLVRRVREAGIARDTTLTFDNVEVPTPQEVSALLRVLIAALEQSPAPRHEWKSVSRAFEPEPLAELLGVSLSSLRRYIAGTRPTPDAVAARLHFLALVIGDLAGTYNDIGVRRWFERPRTALGGRSPSSLLQGEWDPEDEGPAQVRALAESLVSL